MIQHVTEEIQAAKRDAADRWTVMAQVSGKTSDGWSFGRQIPTFELSNAVYGFSGPDHVARVAADVLHSVDPTVRVSVTVHHVATGTTRSAVFEPRKPRH